MKFKITVTLPSDHERNGKKHFVYECENKNAALKRLQTILTRGTSQSFEYRDTDLLNSQTVFYPAHLIERISVEPPIPDFD